MHIKIHIQQWIIEKLADFKEVMSKHVNWNVLWTITGIAIYCRLAQKMNVITLLGEWLQNLSPAVIAAICAVGALLSFVVSASAILPFLYEMIPALAAAAGVLVAAMIVPMVLGAGETSLNPFSTGGAASLIGAPPEVANKMVTPMIITAVVQSLVVVLIAFTCVMGIGA